MPGLRFVYLLALVVWVGGLLVLTAVVAPALVDVLTSRVPGEGELLASAAFGTILRRFHLVAAACATLMGGGLVVMALIGPRPRPYGPRLALIGFMLFSTAILVLPIGWQMQALQAAVDDPMASRSTSDARRTSVERLHRLAGGLLTLEALAGLTLLFWEARERRS